VAAEVRVHRCNAGFAAFIESTILAASADGKAHVLLVEMDFDGTAPYLALQSAIKAGRGATFLARGYAGEKGAFAMSRCRFVYRLPQE
jgi:hypothetical protein